MHEIKKAVKKKKVSWWVKVLLHMKFGKCKTPSGKKFQGIKAHWTWQINSKEEPLTINFVGGFLF